MTFISRPVAAYPVHPSAVDPLRITGIYELPHSYVQDPGFFRERDSVKLLFPWLYNGEDPVQVFIRVYPCDEEDRQVVDELNLHTRHRYALEVPDTYARFRKYQVVYSRGQYLKSGKMYEVHCEWLDKRFRFVSSDTEKLGRLGKALEKQHTLPVSRAWLLGRLFTTDMCYTGGQEYPGDVVLDDQHQRGSGSLRKLDVKGLQRCQSLTIGDTWDVPSINVRACNEIHLKSPTWEGFKDYRSEGFSLTVDSITGVRGPVHMLPIPSKVLSGALRTHVSVLCDTGQYAHVTYEDFYNCMREVATASLSGCMNFLTHDWIPVKALVEARVNGTLRFPIE